MAVDIIARAMAANASLKTIFIDTDFESFSSETSFEEALSALQDGSLSKRAVLRFVEWNRTISLFNCTWAGEGVYLGQEGVAQIELCFDTSYLGEEGWVSDGIDLLWDEDGIHTFDIEHPEEEDGNDDSFGGK